MSYTAQLPGPRTTQILDSPTFASPPADTQKVSAGGRIYAVATPMGSKVFITHVTASKWPGEWAHSCLAPYPAVEIHNRHLSYHVWRTFSVTPDGCVYLNAFIAIPGTVQRSVCIYCGREES